MSDTALNLPAAAALAESEASLAAQIEAVRAGAHSDYSEQSKAELAALYTKVRADRPPWLKIENLGSGATKGDYIRVLADAAAAQSSPMELLRKLEQAAAAEQRILDKVAETPTIEQVRAQRSAEIAGVGAGWDAERIADIAYAYEATMATTESWLSVGSIMRSQGKSPAEALAFVVEYQVREVIMSAGRSSRSSSATTNLAREAKLAGQAKFIEQARWMQ